MPGRTIVITGASDGIGAAAARSLAGSGEQVVLVGRSPVKTRALADELAAPHHVCDFADLAQVRALATALRGSTPHIDVLVNNAGAIMPGYERTVDGHEKTMQVNHLAPFLLTNLLLPELRAGDGVVVSTASDEAAKGRIDPTDLGSGDASAFRPKQVYADSKLANVLFTRELASRHGGDGIKPVAFHPGIVASNFASDTTTNWRWVYNTPLRHLVLTSPEKGIRTLLWLLDGTPDSTWAPGVFYIGRKPTSLAQSEDPRLAAQVWDRSADLVGLA
ncbi:SDR family NAD(P)-dependent oxidoreductase [Jatrophihabitans endophyticus]|uniref:SDR family NAD(P)-dependent oxidoreductase n=1 Tax=Jatrophihabitans endophyticus TaxID=1206085 RepID=UPI0019E9FCA1|nr:SDR family NAD(P)-dependent oxidoreductase [Jatrophihabitans endophyticus]MBE7187112.1 SDR family NAD(P)-dependent oxidoreductase [Jatrophihabitans endophyticus]